MLLIILIVSRAKARDIFFAENVLITAVDRMHTLSYICPVKGNGVFLLNRPGISGDDGACKFNH
jgi:hypothetical protein